MQYLQTINFIEGPASSMVAIPARQSGLCASGTLCVYEVHVNDILMVQNPHLILLPAIQLKNKVELD